MNARPDRRNSPTRFRFTGPGKLFLGVALFLYFASLTSQSGLLILPVGIIVVCYPLNLLSAWRGVNSLEIVPPPSGFAEAGQRVAQPWRLQNRARSPVGLITAESNGQSLLRLPYLRPNEERHLVPELAFPRRGVYRHAEVRFSSLFPFGLLEASRTFDLPGEVVVCPKLFRVAAPDFGGSASMIGGKLQGRKTTSSGTFFAGIRPFRPGDPLRQIHWKSSGKGRGLMAKTFHEEIAGRVSIYLDTGAALDADLFEQAVEASGSLLFSALEEGHHAEWLDSSSDEPMLVPPFADSQPVLDRLARIVQGPHKPGGLGRAAGLLSRKSGLHLFLGGITEPLARELRQLASERRRVSVYLPAGANPAGLPEGFRLFFYRPGEIGAAPNHAAAA